MARRVYNGKVSVGFLAAIVASANAGGAGSVIGDTTTTMMWLAGVSPLACSGVYWSDSILCDIRIAGRVCTASLCPILHLTTEKLTIDWIRVGVVVGILAAIVITNVGSNIFLPGLEEGPRCLVLRSGSPSCSRYLCASWIGASHLRRRRGRFLIALVALASLVPVETLRRPSWPVTFALGWLSSIFDNIPLTALALEQGGYDWALLAYAVGIGGSMVWFGSSAGVALTSQFPEGRSMVVWLREGWHVPLAYVTGIFVMLALRGWSPTI